VSILGPTARVAILIAGGAFAVHQLRYGLPLPGDISHSQVHAHGYLDFVGPVLVWALAAAIASWVLSLGAKSGAGELGPIRCSWRRASLALILIYCVQEGVEGALAPGHSDLLSGIFSHGGWVALPLSVLVGGLVSLVLLGSRAVRRAVTRRPAPGPRRRPGPRPLRPARTQARRPVPVLAANLAGRAPPFPI
jgi:hypothetical protein